MYRYAYCTGKPGCRCLFTDSRDTRGGGKMLNTFGELMKAGIQAVWRGNRIVTVSPYLSNGHMLILKSAVLEPQYLAILESPYEEEADYPKITSGLAAQMMQEICSAPRQEIKGFSLHVPESGDSQVRIPEQTSWSLRAAYFDLILTVTRADRCAKTQNSEHGPVLFYKDGQPVAAIMPMRRIENDHGKN